MPHSNRIPVAPGNLSRRLFRRILALPVLPECIAGLTHADATIFMAHRFCDPETGVSGHNPQALRRVLAHLRKRRYDLTSIGEIFRRLREREPLKRAVAFTIDDGYYEMGQIAAPVFADFDCPVTIFVFTDFHDGKMWLWSDKIAYIFAETKRVKISTRLGKDCFHFPLEDDAAREGWRTLEGHCGCASDEDRLACIDELSATAEVEVPSRPPPRYRPLSWDEARRLEGKGISFGPHTLTHPILSAISAEQSEHEITGSWQRLSTEVSRPVPIFCYPGGRFTHFGDREVATMSRMGLWGAVTGEPGNIRSAHFHGSTDRWYRVPRYMCQETIHGTLKCVSGMESLRAHRRGTVQT